MPTKRKWLVLADFEWSPKTSIIVTFKAGQIRTGLTRACIEKAGDRVEEIRE